MRYLPVVPRQFLSTPSARRATNSYLKGDTYYEISIHALREEGDLLGVVNDFDELPFLSTPSARRATAGGRSYRKGVKISIHALREEGDGEGSRLRARGRDFYPRPPRGGRLGCPTGWLLSSKFLSTPSARRATAKTARKPSAFVSLYTSLHKLHRGVCKPNRKITPLLAQTAGIPVRSVRENHVRCLFALAGYQKISTLSCANSGCSPTCSTLVW